MRDVVWTIIIIWLVFRIYNAFKSRRTVVFNKQETNHYHYKKEGEVKIEQPHNHQTKNKKQNNDGDYIDYEEIK
jgi:hypothetical protein